MRNKEETRYHGRIRSRTTMTKIWRSLCDKWNKRKKEEERGYCERVTKKGWNETGNALDRLEETSSSVQQWNRNAAPLRVQQLQWWREIVAVGYCVLKSNVTYPVTSIIRQPERIERRSGTRKNRKEKCNSLLTDRIFHIPLSLSLSYSPC